MSKIGTATSGGGTWSWAIALDGGTTNTRARLVHEGRIVATARREVGVRDTVLTERSGVAGLRPLGGVGQGRSPGQALAEAVREAIAEVADSIPGARGEAARGGRPDLIVAAGMLSSEVGLLGQAVPHVEAPAGLDELAQGLLVRSIPEVAEEAITFVPGLRTPPHDGPDGWMWADVMRGEECETLGALCLLDRGGLLDAGQGERVFLWPGSHAKLVEVDGRGRIMRSQTSLAGELLHAVARHTLVAASLPAELPDQIDIEAAEAGARAAARQGLGRAAFLVRVAALGQTMSPEDRAGFWIGAVVADDIASLIRHPILGASRPVWVGGREPLRGLYARRLAQLHRGPVTPLNDDLAEAASAIGALEISTRRMKQHRP
jgi:2-dehydro-3-deoxygalactonokinase